MHFTPAHHFMPPQVMYRMYRTTGNPDHLRMARLFDKPRFFTPLTRGEDPLPHLHANTHLAQVGTLLAVQCTCTQDSEGGMAFSYACSAVH